LGTNLQALASDTDGFLEVSKKHSLLSPFLVIC